MKRDDEPAAPKKENSMSFIITLYFPQAIVMAADSYSTGFEKKGEEVQIVGPCLTDKLFLTPSGIGIGTWGTANIQGKPIAHHIDGFIDKYLAKPDFQVDRAAHEIFEHFRGLGEPQEVGFLVAGYKTTNGTPRPHIWRILTNKNAKRVNSDCHASGYVAKGETEIFMRLTENVATWDQKEKALKWFRHFPIHWRKFSLQDAITYAIYAVQVTIDTIRFQCRPKTVGGPVDVLVIKPDEAFWVQKKELHA